MADETVDEIAAQLAAKMDAQFIVDQLAQASPVLKEQLANDIAEAMWSAQRARALKDSKQFVTQRYLHNNQEVTTNLDGRVIGFGGGKSQFDRVNIVGGSMWIESRNQTELTAAGSSDRPFDDARQVNITVGAGADCMFDYLLSTCFASLAGFSQGQTFTTLSGCTFKGYSTSAALFAALNALTVNGTYVVYACHGTYTTNAVAIDLDSGVRVEIFGSGQEATIFQRTTATAGQSVFTVTDYGNNIYWHQLRIGQETVASASVYAFSGGTNGSMYFESCVIAGILGGEFDGSKFWDCFFENGLIMDGGGSDTIEWYNCEFGDDTSSAVNCTANGTQWLFEGCRSNRGWEFNDTSTITARITGCKFGTSGTTDTWLHFTGNCAGRVEVVGCDFAPPATANGSIYIENVSANFEIAVSGGNTFAMTTSSAFSFITSGDAAARGIFTGNVFQAQGAGSDQHVEDNGGTSISGLFSYSVFGPNYPATKVRYNITGSNNEFYPGSSASGSSTGGSVSFADLRYNLYATGSSVDSWKESAAPITAAAGTLTLTTDGDMFHVGAANFSAIATPTRHTLALLIHDGVSIETHGANLILQGATNYTTAAGDSQIFAWEGGTVWREVNRWPATATASGGGHEIFNETSALAQEPDMRFMGRGIFAKDTAASTASDVFVGQIQEAIVDNGDTNAKDVSGSGVYSTIQLAIDAGAATIWVINAGDAADITIDSGDAVTSIIGRSTQESSISVNISCSKISVTFQFLKFDGKSLTLTGQYDIAFACLFTGALTQGTATINQPSETNSGGTVTYALGPPGTLTDTSKAWTVNQWVGSIITSGANTLTCTSNTPTVITSTSAWTPGVPAPGAAYTIPSGIGGGTATGTGAEIVIFDGGADGGLSTGGGYGKIENEYVSWTTATGANSGTFTVGGAGNARTRGRFWTFQAAHTDNTTITDITKGSLNINGPDIEVTACRFIGCSTTTAQVVFIGSSGARARITASVFIANTTFSCIALSCGTTNLTPENVSLIGNKFSDNTTQDALVSIFEALDGTTSNSKYPKGFQINGNFFSLYWYAALRLYGINFNISGNVFDAAGGLTTGPTKNFQANGAITTTTATQIPYDNATGTGTIPDKGFLLIDSERIAYSKNTVLTATSGTFDDCVRGWDGTTAATHLDNATITALFNVALLQAPGDAVAGARNHIYSGNSIVNTKIANWGVSVASNNNVSTATPAYLADNIIINTTITYAAQNYTWANNVIRGAHTYDFQNAANQAITGGSGGTVSGPTLTNVPAGAYLWTSYPNFTAGPAAPMRLPTGRNVEFGAAAGDLVTMTIPMTNKTGANSVAANIAMIKNVTDNAAFIDNAGAASTRVCGVQMETGVADGSPCMIAVGGVVTVTCTTAGAVVRGDLLEASATAGQAQTAAVPVLGGVFAKALTAKAAAAAGSVVALLTL